MPRRSWIIHHGQVGLVNAPYRTVEGWPNGFQDLSQSTELPVGYGPYLADCLHWGPHHPDFPVQDALRSCYFRNTTHSDTTGMRLSLDALRSGDELVLWGDPRLGSCLVILWALDWLNTHQADLSRVTLVIDPRPYPGPYATLEEFGELFASRMPVGEHIRPLVEIRRFLASDSEQVEADLSGIPGVLGDWLRVTRHLADFLPDDRGPMETAADRRSCHTGERANVFHIGRRTASGD